MATSSKAKQNPAARARFALTLGLALSLTLGATFSFAPSNAIASGGSTAGSFGGGSPSRKADESYEYGKSVYLGRLPDAQKINYCVLVDGEPKKLKKRTLKPYRGKTLSDLANALYLCEDMSELALRSLEKEQVAFVLYYLNKRYRLKLTDS